MTEIRPAVDADAEAMADIQNAIHAAGLRSSPVTVDLIRERYLGGDNRVACTVAVREGHVIGFQVLARAWPGNPYGVSEGWGIIGTHVHPEAGRGGVGRALFAESEAAARAAGLEHIDASIGADNTAGIAYYRAMGFRPYRHDADVWAHRLDL